MRYMETVTFGYKPPNLEKFRMGLRDRILRQTTTEVPSMSDHISQLNRNKNSFMKISQAMKVTNPMHDISALKYTGKYKLVPERVPTVIEGLNDKGKKVAMGLEADLLPGGRPLENTTAERYVAVHPNYIANRKYYT